MELNSQHLPNPGVEEVVRSAARELTELLRQRAQIMKRIGGLKQTLVGLANLFGDSILNDELLELLDRRPPTRHPGFTRACRLVLMEATAPLETRQICDQLRRRYPELLARHKDPVASVTTVLTRLVEYGEARSATTLQGRKTWEWAAERQNGAAGLLLQATSFGRVASPHA
ncbi:MAG TPA: hypothetical protein VFA68_10890 [Terriglobales bacterium]|nr:hypothetical protein [Terriglobales bacterium]